MAHRRAALIILDGWGYREGGEDNAVSRARTPRLEALRVSYPFSTLGASGMAVGLPSSQMGNSEVGHLNLGAGRVVYQDFTRINLSIQNGSFFDNDELRGACEAANAAGGSLHLMGLLSDGGVHSHRNHLNALLDLASRQHVEKVYVHAFLDGRDTPPQSGRGFVEDQEAVLAKRGIGRIASASGRYYAMDRDTRWERVEKAFRALVLGEGLPASTAVEAVTSAYDGGETDEFVVPRVILGEDGEPVGTIRTGDVVIFFNFRADRAREITRAFTEPGFSGFEASYRPQLSRYVTFTQYDETFDLPIAFPPQRMDGLLGEVVAKAGLRQLRIAETEKYAHVTFFFNGGEEDAFSGEERILIPSPREVATYDEKPEMSAPAVKDRLVQEIYRGVHDLIVVNFANLDMVGHTGNFEAAVRAVEVVDGCVGDVTDALRACGCAGLITGDHGNAEEMRDPGTHQVHTAHTTNPVPLLLIDDERRGSPLREGGILADVAPTLLEIMGLPQPSEMTGRSLLGS